MALQIRSRLLSHSILSYASLCTSLCDPKAQFASQVCIQSYSATCIDEIDIDAAQKGFQQGSQSLPSIENDLKPAQVNVRLLSAKSVSNLERTLDKYSHVFDGINISSLLTSLVRLVDPKAKVKPLYFNTSQISSIVIKVERLLEKQGGKLTLRELSSIVSSLAKLRDHAIVFGLPKLVSSVLQRYPPESLKTARKTVMNSIDLSLLAWGCANLSIHDPSVFNWVSKTLPVRFRNANARHISVIVWSFAKAGFYDESLLTAVADGIVNEKLQGDLGPVEICQLLCAFAELDFKHEAAIYELLSLSASKVEKFNAAQTSVLFWVCGVLKIVHEPFLVAFAADLDQKIPYMDGHALCNLAWGTIRFDRYDENTYIMISRRAQEIVSKLSTRDAVSLAWAFAKVQHVDESLFDCLQDVIAGKVQHLGTWELATSIWAFTSVNHVEPRFFGKLIERSREHLQEFSFPQLAKLVWAMAKSDQYDSDVFEQVAKRATEIFGILAPEPVLPGADGKGGQLTDGGSWYGKKEPDSSKSRSDRDVLSLIDHGVSEDGHRSHADSASEISEKGDQRRPSTSAMTSQPHPAKRHHSSEAPRDRHSTSSQATNQKHSDDLDLSFPGDLSIPQPAEGSHGTASLHVPSRETSRIPTESDSAEPGAKGPTSHSAVRVEADGNSEENEEEQQFQIEQERKDTKSSTIAMLAWAYAKMRHNDTELFKAITAHAIGSVNTYGIREVTSLLWSCAVLQHFNPSFMKASSRRLRPIASTLSPATMANVAWSFAMLNHVDHKLFDRLATEALAKMEAFSRPHVDRLCWSYRRLGFSDVNLFDKMWKQYHQD